MAKKFISKGEWFDKGTEAILLFEYGILKNGKNLPYPDDFPMKDRGGLFSGIRNGKPDEEGCGFEEFDIIED